MTHRQDLLEALGQIQNHPVHQHHDILTIHGCRPVSTPDQLRRAIEGNLAQIALWSNYGGNTRRLARVA
jgi:hypothetical protein